MFTDVLPRPCPWILVGRIVAVALLLMLPTDLVIETTALPVGQSAAPYVGGLAAVGDVPPYRRSIAEGALPEGLVLSPVVGEISGIPNTIGRHEFPLDVLDATGDRSIQAMTIDVVRASLSNALDMPCRISPGQWCELPATRMSDVFPAPEAHPAWGIMGPQAVTAAWGGGAFDTKRHRLIITGGGHADYGGNEVYEFDLASTRWRRATEPSRVREVRDGQFAVVDGEAPVSSHTYGGLVYLPNVDRMFKFGGSYYRSGHSYDPHVYFYDLDRHAWSRRAAAPRTVLTPAADYDPNTGHVLVISGVGLMSYDPIADTWKLRRVNDADLPLGAAALDHDRRRFVMTSRSGELFFYDLEPIAPRQRAPLRGQADWGGHVGLAYHPPSRRLVLWQGGREVWTVDALTWNVCRLATEAGPAPTATTAGGQPKTQGIYGRWRYVPGLDAFVAYNDSSGNVWLYKLPDRPEPSCG